MKFPLSQISGARWGWGRGIKAGRGWDNMHQHKRGNVKVQAVGASQNPRKSEAVGTYSLPFLLDYRMRTGPDNLGSLHLREKTSVPLRSLVS